MLNLFLLFHKCGNNYVNNVHNYTPHVTYFDNFERYNASEIIRCDHVHDVINVRCRNFNYSTLKNNNLLNCNSTRFLVFTRNPASFIISATNYHLRGSEAWAVTQPQPHFNGKSFNGALKEAMSDDDRYIITMRQFAWLFESMISFMSILDDSRFMRIRNEDLFLNKEDEFFIRLSEFLRLSSDVLFINALKRASPSFKNKLPGHSTGAFKIEHPYLLFGDKAKNFYDENYAHYEKILGYSVRQDECR